MGCLSCGGLSGSNESRQLAGTHLTVVALIIVRATRCMWCLAQLAHTATALALLCFRPTGSKKEVEYYESFYQKK